MIKGKTCTKCDIQISTLVTGEDACDQCVMRALIINFVLRADLDVLDIIFTFVKVVRRGLNK